MDDEAMRGRGEDAEKGERERKTEGARKVPFFSMFRYASRADMALMAVGTVAAMVNGMGDPLMTVVFAAVIDCFGAGDNVLQRVSKVVMYYIYLGIGTALASFLQVSCWTMTGERQSIRIRSLYLEAVLKQDVSFFDVEMTTGEAISRMSADTVLVQDALGEKVGKYAQLLTTFVGCFIIGFVRGWMLALVMLACIPPNILSFAIMSRLRSQISARRQASYADAGNVVEQTIGAIRTAYETMVGQNGAQLSGGQKQRIAIARAILKNPRVLLLDEATSALDMESERVVQEALNRIMVGITTLIVAHRLSTVRNADCIAVVHQGKVAERGVHDDLIKDPDGAYSHLIRLQQANTEETPEMPYVAGSRFKSTSLSLEQSIRDSPRNRRQHSSKSVGLSRSDDLFRHVASREEHLEIGDSEARKKAPIGRLFNLSRPEAPILLLAIIAATVHGLLFPSFSIMMSGGIRTFYYPAHQLRKDSTFWALMCLLMAIISLVSIQLEFYLFGVAGGKLIERVRALSFQSIIHQEVAWFDDPSNSSGALGARLFIDALNIRRLVGDNLAVLVQCTVTLICGFGIAFASDWKLTLSIIGVIPFLGLQNYIQLRFLKGFGEDAKVMYEDASQVVAEAIGSIRTVASFGAEKRVITLYSQKCQASMKQGIRSGMVGGVGFSSSNLMLYLTYALCFYVGAQFVHDGKSTFQNVFRVYFALVFTAFGISQTSDMASDSTKGRESATSILAFIDRKPKIDSTSDEGIKLEKVDGTIEFNHVRFKYPSRPDVQIFSDFTLGIASGKTTALVGESGSGKSTVIALLERFYDPDSGTISLDGTELRKLTLSWLRDQMGLVSQEPVLFNDTIRANIAYGKRGEATEEEIITVAKAANAHEFISSLPQGYNTNVGERGTQLSGGQKQRVAIARAILKDPRILLLDEATSALDAELEHIVQDTLDQVMVSRTTIVVAHCLSTIKGADMIAVIKDGSVAEKGKHESLMGIKGGVYASLVELHSKAA
ncbi:ABC transporter B family member 9-like isoform X2 [Triticum urartu]|uniref:ABC transporter B family member 9-like isoform X2 n=1 Tax=Triticum urartu TaxID=4572 RepID=UPI002043F492|nr:ABC transporter B family member 9-like isoform X2 [Triticum urartu]